MSTQTKTVEASFKAPPAKMFKAMDHWIKLGPNGLTELLSSSGGHAKNLFGSEMKFPTVRERIDVADFENYEAKGVVVEGGDVGRKFESFAFHYKGQPTADGGCIIKLTTTATARPGVDVSEAMAKSNEGAILLLKAAEAYILSNPSAYA